MRMSSAACLLAGVVIGTGVVLSAQAAKPKAASPAKGVLWPAADLKWVDNPAVKGAQQAVLWGDPAKGAFGALKHITAGTVLPMHSHANAMREVVVAGTIILQFEGSPAKDMGPQSYSLIPAGQNHIATCKAGADCVYFETSTGLYDLKLAAK